MSDWDRYFLRIAKEVASNSKCFSRQIGSVLVKEKRVVSSGYNGASVGIRRCNDWIKDEGWPIDNFQDICPRRKMGFESGQGLHICPAAHSERNAILSAALNGIATKGTTLYAYCNCPCMECCKEIINAGISKVVCLNGKDYDPYGRLYLKEAGVELVQIDMEPYDGA
jgi:dCMP deaminase